MTSPITLLFIKAPLLLPLLLLSLMIWLIVLGFGTLVWSVRYLLIRMLIGRQAADENSELTRA
ncbi:hypothetical protein [Spirosoma sp.]|uniref:hypothetical protein n=1 Tax=Spirosoma sp. TaxID=1899569 RepID=UPI003B3ACC70